MAELITTRELQGMLHIDRTTIYRMVGDGRLRGIRVGKQWRFDRSDIEELLSSTPFDHDSTTERSSGAGDATPRLLDSLPIACSQLVQDAFAELLGVTLVITERNGEPVTRPSNLPGKLVDAAGVAETGGQLDWLVTSGELGLEPHFVAGDSGLLWTRGMIRSSNDLLGMLVAGGFVPTSGESSIGGDAVQLHHCLGMAEQQRLLSWIQRIADIFSHMVQDRSTLCGRLAAIASLARL